MLDLASIELIPRSVAASMTNIEWCDFSNNHWTVCSEMPAAPGAKSGCAICYARSFAKRLGLGWGPGVPRHRFAGAGARARRLDRLAALTGLPFSVFSLSLGDWLDPEVDPSWRTELVDTVEATPHLNWLLLTHRPHLVGKLAPASWRSRLPAHIWPGVTVDHRQHARRWHELAQYWGDTGRAWISAEPLASGLGGLDFAGACTIILGGASGTNDPAWALDPAWVGEMVAEHGEVLFFKQWGDHRGGRRVGKKQAGRDLGGRAYDFTAWPRHREVLAEAAKREAA